LDSDQIHIKFQIFRTTGSGLQLKQVKLETRTVQVNENVKSQTGDRK